MTPKIRVAKDYMGLPKGNCYYLFPPCPSAQTTRLLLYVKGESGWYTRILRFDRKEFEEGLHKAFLILDSDDRGLPPYLADVDTSRIYKQLTCGDSTASQVCNERLQLIAPLVEEWGRISADENPDGRIKEYVCEQESEPPRVSRRLQPLREWSHYEYPQE